MSGGYPLTGIDPADPVPGIIRELRFAQGASSGVGTSRTVVLYGNKTSGGTATVDTITETISSYDDAVTLAGARSELMQMYRCFVAVDPNADIKFGVISENGSGTAASATLTFVNAATGSSTVKVTCIGETIEIGVENGDSISTIATNVSNKINAQTNWPVTASPSSGVVTITSANVGVRATQHLTALLGSFTKDVTTTITKSSVTAGTGADDNTNVLAAAAAGTYYYHVGPYDVPAATSTFSATDSDVGEHATYIATQALPANGKEQVLIFSGTTKTHAQADTYAGAHNKARSFYFPCPGNDWSAAMIAAHVAAVIRSKQIGHPGANLTDYGKSPNDIFSVPVPYTKSNIPSVTQARAHLQNGCSVISWTTQGQPYIMRHITTYCGGGTAGTTPNYRLREGHIVSVVDYFWAWVFTRYFSQKQPFVAADPKEGEVPKQGVTYPSTVTSLVIKTMRDALDFPGGPLLDPGSIDVMTKSVNTKLLTEGGISCKAQVVSVLHNNKGQFVIEEISDQQ